jgi:hypothetical protein
MFAFRCPKSFQAILSKGFNSALDTKKPAQGGHFCLVEAGGIFAPSMALTLRAIGFADVHFGVLPL